MIDWVLITGVAGLAMLLSGFILGEFLKIGEDTISYNILNIIGSVLLAVYAVKLNSIPFMILETVWAIVAIYKLIILLVKPKTYSS